MRGVVWIGTGAGGRRGPPRPDSLGVTSHWIRGKTEIDDDDDDEYEIIQNIFFNSYSYLYSSQSISFKNILGKIK